MRTYLEQSAVFLAHVAFLYLVVVLEQRDLWQGREFRQRSDSIDAEVRAYGLAQCVSSWLHGLKSVSGRSKHAQERTHRMPEKSVGRRVPLALVLLKMMVGMESACEDAVAFV
jgi:hypothetical protein